MATADAHRRSAVVRGRTTLEIVLRGRHLLPTASPAGPHGTRSTRPTRPGRTCTSGTVAGGPDLPQRVGWSPRSRVQDPASCRIAGRRSLRGGRGKRAPGVVAATGGGMILDVDGHSLIDQASGSRHRRREHCIRGGRPGDRAGGGVYPHLLHGRAVRGVRRGVQALVELTPGDHSKKEALCNSGAEAVENAVGSLGCTPGATQSWCSITPTTAAPT